MTRQITWTYGDNPATSPADALRFIIGDVNGADPLLSDGEVAYLLATYPDTNLAALYALESVVLQYARQVDETVGPVSVSFSQRLTNLQGTLDVLRSRYAIQAGFEPYAGGLSYSDKRKYHNDQDRDTVRPSFKAHERCDAWGEGNSYYDEFGPKRGIP